MAGSVGSGGNRRVKTTLPPMLEHVPDPPAMVQSESEKRFFRTLCENAIEAQTLAKTDLLFVGFTARILALLDRQISEGDPRIATMLRVLHSQLTALGLTPAARRNVPTLSKPAPAEDDSLGL